MGKLTEVNDPAIQHEGQAVSRMYNANIILIINVLYSNMHGYMYHTVCPICVSKGAFCRECSTLHLHGLFYWGGPGL